MCIRDSCKRLLGALAENIGKYESQFGEISLDNKPATFNISDLNNNGPKS